MTLLKPRNLLLLLALLLFGALAAIVAYRYRPPANVAELVKALPSGVDVALQEIRYSHTEGGVERWRLVAGRVEHRAADRLTAIRNLELRFFDAKGVEQGVLKAINGQVNSDFSVIEVRDQVEFVIQNGYRLQTTNLTYTQRDRSIRTDAPVLMAGKTLELRGVGLHIDFETRRLKILDRVHAMIRVSPEKQEKS